MGCKRPPVQVRLARPENERLRSFFFFWECYDIGRMNLTASERRNFLRDAAVLVLSVVVAVMLAKAGVVERVVDHADASVLLASFFAGLFFTSAFTTAPAIVVLGQLAQLNSPWPVALVGGLGAAVGDLLLFKLFRDTVGNDIRTILKHSCGRACVYRLRTKPARLLSVIVGGFVLASPLPDEVGLALMGVTRVHLRLLVPLAYTFNTLGILAIGYAAQALAR